MYRSREGAGCDGDEVWSDLQALKGLYGLLHTGQQAKENLDEASRSLLMRMLDNATQQALLKQAKMLSGPLMSPALARRLSIQACRSPAGDAGQHLKPLASPSLSLSLHASEWSRRPKPRSPARNQDGRHDYDDHRRRERDDRLLARVASNRSSRTAMPRLHPSTPEQSLSRQGSHRSSRAVDQRRGPASGSASRLSRSDRHSRLRRGSGRGDRSSSSPESSSSRCSVSRARELGAGGSSTLRRIGRLDSRLSMGGVTSRRGSERVVAPRRGDRSSSSSSSPERGSRRCSVSRAPSTAWLHGRSPALELGAGGSSTLPRIGRLDSRLSMGGVTSRGGSERVGRGAANPRLSSSRSDSEAVTIRSRVRTNRELVDRCVRRAEEIEDVSLRRRGNKGGTVCSVMSTAWSSRPRRALDRIDSGSTYSSSSSASIPSPSTSPTAPSTPGASDSSCSSSVSESRRGGVRPEYSSEESSSASRSRRRRERQERREGRLRRFKNKLALVFHHRHDHHHHHHHHIGRRSGSPVSRRDRRGKKTKSPWSYLGGMSHHRTAGHDGGNKNSATTKTVVTAKRRGGGGHTRSLFDAVVRHKWGGPRAPEQAGMMRTRSLSRVQVKKTNWWQQLKRRRGRAEGSGRPRRRLGQGKTL